MNDVAARAECAGLVEDIIMIVHLSKNEAQALFHILFENGETVQMKDGVNFQPEGNRRPSTMEGFEITQEIVRRHKLEYISRSFKISAQSVAKWLSSNTDIFTRVKRFMQDLVEDGDRDLAMRLARLFCDAVGCIPTHKPPKQVGLLSLLQALSQDAKSAAGVQIDVSDMIANQVCALDEIERALRSVREQQETADRVRSQLEFLKTKAKEQGGSVVLDMDRLNKKILDSPT